MTDFFAELDRLYQDGDSGAVEAFLLSGLSRAERESLESASILNELAGFYRGTSRFREASDAFSRALAIFRTHGMFDTPEYATVQVNLAGMHRLMGEASTAATMLHNALESLERSGARGGYAYMSALNNLALVYQELSDYDKAYSYAEQSYRLIKSGGGEEHELATALNNLAAIKLKSGDIAEAEELISQSLELYDAMAEVNVHHAAALTTRGAVLCRIGEHSAALDDFSRALNLTRHFFGKNIEYASCLKNMAQVYEMLGDADTAALKRDEANAILGSLAGA